MEPPQHRPDLEERLSFSRIGTFIACKALYRNRYIDKIPVPKTESYFLLGSAVHAGLETLYRAHPGADGTSPTDMAPLVRDGLDTHWVRWFEREGLSRLWPAFKSMEGELSGKIADLNFRASGRCNDPKVWIRNRDGSVPKVPSMNAAYKRELDRLGIESRFADLDAAAREVSPTLQASTFSLAETLVNSYEVAQVHRDFEGVVRVHGVELGFTQPDEGNEGQFKNLVTLAGRPIQGFIDLVVELADNGITIVDHKTSKAEATPLDVTYHEQLNLYAHALEVGLGVRASSIALNSARFGSKVIVPIDWSIVQTVLRRKENQVRAIEEEQDFFPQDPFAKYVANPCLGRANPPYGPGTLGGACPYLNRCHPDLHARLSHIEAT